MLVKGRCTLMRIQVGVENRERQPSKTDVPWPSRGSNRTVTSGSALRHNANLVSPQYPDFGIVTRISGSYVVAGHVNGPVIPTFGVHCTSRHIQGITSRVPSRKGRQFSHFWPWSKLVSHPGQVLHQQDDIY